MIFLSLPQERATPPRQEVNVSREKTKSKDLRQERKYGRTEANLAVGATVPQDPQALRGRPEHRSYERLPCRGGSAGAGPTVIHGRPSGRARGSCDVAGHAWLSVLSGPRPTLRTPRPPKMRPKPLSVVCAYSVLLWASLLYPPVLYLIPVTSYK